jgi:adenosylcobalamin-dependent ribonucleoside-triphosphate reductase
MNVRKRDGSLEPINLGKIISSIQRGAVGLPGIDPSRVAVRTIGSLYDGATTQELDQQSIQTAASLIPEDDAYSKLAAYLLAEVIRKEVLNQGIHSFSQSIAEAFNHGLIDKRIHEFVQKNARKLNNAIDDSNNRFFEYYGLNSVYENTLRRFPDTGKVLETPQYFFMRMCVDPTEKVADIIKAYRMIARTGISITASAGPKAATTEHAIADQGPVPSRPLMPGMGQAVAERTILRKKEDGSWEEWCDVADRVAIGNAMLASTDKHSTEQEYQTLRRHIAKGNTLMSGRHLQHGDSLQPTRNMEVFTNCSTAAASFLSFYLLLNGSGVGRAYDDDMMLVNFDYAPNLRCVLDSSHPDFDWDTHESLRDAKHKYGSGENVIWFQVEDSREGWAKAVEQWEYLAFEKVNVHKLLVLDFSGVRHKGSPIGGMQNRPASGPVPLMNAFMKAAALKGAGLAPWLQAMYVDHYFAECVLVGGARRAARMSTKYWRDRTVLDFIVVKRPIEYIGLSVEEITKFRQEVQYPPMGFLWSSNNSVTVDEEFWAFVNSDTPEHLQSDDEKHAKAVFNLSCSAAYGDGTGEPGFINLHKLTQKDRGLAEMIKKEFVESPKYKLNDETQLLLRRLAKKAAKKKYNMITNPCGEICLFLLGAFCVIADVVPFHCDTLDEAEDCFRAVTRALMRVNLMDSIYSKEVRRTNRIGVGLTGVHEFAWKFFGYGFLDLIDEEKSKDFWLTMARFNRAVADEATNYAAELGVEVPHTSTTIKPAGTTSKLFGLTEGWHLPAMAYYLRWVQFRSDDPLVQQYKNNGYPVRELVSYSGTTIVGFPTAPTIANLGMGDKLVTAGNATPEQQFQWLMLGEKYWIHGTDENGIPVKESIGGQISYTLKYKPGVVDYDHFKAMIKQYQSQVRCCSVMPQEDTSSYEYLPEEAITRDKYFELKEGLVQSVLKKADIREEVGREHVLCENGACPVDFNTGSK